MSNSGRPTIIKKVIFNFYQYSETNITNTLKIVINYKIERNNVKSINKHKIINSE